MRLTDKTSKLLPQTESFSLYLFLCFDPWLDNSEYLLCVVERTCKFLPIIYPFAFCICLHLTINGSLVEYYIALSITFSVHFFPCFSCFGINEFVILNLFHCSLGFVDLCSFCKLKYISMSKMSLYSSLGDIVIHLMFVIRSVDLNIWVVNFLNELVFEVIFF